MHVLVQLRLRPCDDEHSCQVDGHKCRQNNPQKLLEQVMPSKQPVNTLSDSISIQHDPWFSGWQLTGFGCELRVATENQYNVAEIGWLIEWVEPSHSSYRLSRISDCFLRWFWKVACTGTNTSVTLAATASTSAVVVSASGGGGDAEVQSLQMA